MKWTSSHHHLSGDSWGVCTPQHKGELVEGNPAVSMILPSNSFRRRRRSQASLLHPFWFVSRLFFLLLLLTLILSFSSSPSSSSFYHVLFTSGHYEDEQGRTKEQPRPLSSSSLKGDSNKEGLGSSSYEIDGEGTAIIHAWGESKLIGEGFHRTLSTNVYIARGGTSSFPSSSFSSSSSFQDRVLLSKSLQKRSAFGKRKSRHVLFFPSLIRRQDDDDATVKKTKSLSRSKTASLSCSVECIYTLNKIMYIDPNQTWELGLDSTFHPSHSHLPSSSPPSTSSLSSSSFSPPKQVLPSRGKRCSSAQKEERSPTPCEKSREEEKDKISSTHSAPHVPNPPCLFLSGREGEETKESEGFWSRHISTEVDDSFVNVELPFFSSPDLLPSRLHARQRVTSPLCFSFPNLANQQEEEGKKDNSPDKKTVRKRREEEGHQEASVFSLSREKKEQKNDTMRDPLLQDESYAKAEEEKEEEQGKSKVGEEKQNKSRKESHDENFHTKSTSHPVDEDEVTETRAFDEGGADLEKFEKSFKILKKIPFNLPVHHRYDGACHDCDGYIKHGVCTPQIRLSCCFSFSPSLGKHPRLGEEEERRRNKQDEDLLMNDHTSCDEILFQASALSSSSSSFPSHMRDIHRHVPLLFSVSPPAIDKEEEEMEVSQRQKTREKNIKMIERKNKSDKDSFSGENEEAKTQEERQSFDDALPREREEERKKEEDSKDEDEEFFMLYFNVPVGSVEHLPLVAFLTTSSVLLLAVGTLCVLSFANDEEEEEEEERTEKMKEKPS
ncbi:hypothetical protein CSUI_008651 [Cystoisospora suis]|uniref:Transmembrane protein n=1 Tax=Cystoisospora suis TaxID=483139 RepID=A0A2C6K874_9APIC|nr:hypothetical protein CSUI_008651 [Cystoisospora suis]